MLRRAFSRACLLHKRTAGYTLVELLVVLLIASFMMTTLTGFFQTAVAVRQNAGAQTEAQQGLRALASVITQELRQAGACLPRSGTFVALGGTNSGLTDTLTLRIGLTNPTTGACLRAQIGAGGAAVGATTLLVDSTAGFGDAKRVLVASATTGAAEVYSITGMTSYLDNYQPRTFICKAAKFSALPTRRTDLSNSNLEWSTSAYRPD